jgi:hypothetical protein
MLLKSALSLSWRSVWEVTAMCSECVDTHFSHWYVSSYWSQALETKQITINTKNSRYEATSTHKHCQENVSKLTECHNMEICYTCIAGVIWEFKKWWLGKQPTVIQSTWDLNYSEHIRNALLSVQTLPSSEICHHIIWHMATSISKEHVALTCGPFYLMFLSLPTTPWASCCYRHSPAWF